ncbi:VOC family protein [Embleya sp. AB8]|uniref:VOC family protein n=1 Tax=Embleya sp. AB8 TaxID=3156304 RepID=UPI003C757901
MDVLGGVRAVVYPARDMPAAVAAWTATLGYGPAWESPDYTSFTDGVFEVGLSRLPWFKHPLVFWRVTDIEAAWRELTTSGATALGEVTGGGMAELPIAEVVNGDTKTGIVTMPGRKLAVLKAADGSLIGLMEDTPASW